MITNCIIVGLDDSATARAAHRWAAAYALPTGSAAWASRGDVFGPPGWTTSAAAANQSRPAQPSPR